MTAKTEWVLVPREPVPEMLAAWYRYKSGVRFPDEEPARDTSDYGAYRALLSAAPVPAEAQAVGYVRQQTLDALPLGLGGPIVGVPAFDTTIPLYLHPSPSGDGERAQLIEDLQAEGQTQAARIAELEAAALRTSPPPSGEAGEVTDEMIELARTVYNAKNREYDHDFHRDMSIEEWTEKYGTNLHSTSLGERWAMRHALLAALPTIKEPTDGDCYCGGIAGGHMTGCPENAEPTDGK